MTDPEALGQAQAAAHPKASAEALAFVEEAEAEAAEAKAVAAAASARTRAAQLRRRAAELDQSDKSDATEEIETTSESETATTEDAIDEERAAVDEADTDQGTDESVPTPARSPRRWLRLPTWKPAVAVLAVVVTCACMAASGYMMWHHRAAVKERQRSAEFAAAARQEVVALMSLDFTKAKEDVQRIIDTSTGRFRDDFQANADDLVKTAQQSKVVTHTDVSAAAVASMTANSAVVLVAAKSTVTNSTGTQGPRSWRLSVTMTRDGGNLKMSKVEFVL